MRNKIGIAILIAGLLFAVVLTKDDGKSEGSFNARDAAVVNPLLNIYEPKTVRYTNYNRNGIFMFDPYQLYLLLDYTDDQALFDDLERFMPGFKKQGYKIIKKSADDCFLKIAKGEHDKSYFMVYQDTENKVKVFYKNEDKIIYEEFAMCGGDKNMHSVATNPICQMKLPNRNIKYHGNKDGFFYNNCLRIVLPYTDNEKLFADIAKIFCGFDKKDFKIRVNSDRGLDWLIYMERLVDGARSTESIWVSQNSLNEVELSHHMRSAVLEDDTEAYNSITQNGKIAIEKYVAQLDDGSDTVEVYKLYDVVTKKLFVAIDLIRKSEDGCAYMLNYYVPFENVYPKDKADFGLK